MVTYSNRRVFLNKKFHLFTIIQEKDGSIYFTWPNFENSRWIVCKEFNNGEVFVFDEKPEDKGKFTVHGSGMAGFRSHKGRYNKHLIFENNHLISSNNETLGYRHLLTFQMNEPSVIPINSPFLNRQSDYSILASEICPVVLVFFACPKMNLSININISFEEMVNNIGGDYNVDFVGIHSIELKTHSILWMAYKTSSSKWPEKTSCFYDNGYKVPLIFEKEDNLNVLQLRNPRYIMNELNDILISF